jgi:hypothetical protein
MKDRKERKTEKEEREGGGGGERVKEGVKNGRKEERK